LTLRTPRFSTSIPNVQELVDSQDRQQLIELDLSQSEMHHLQNVLRISLGNTVEVIDTTSAILIRGEIVSMQSSTISMKIDKVTEPMDFRLTLIAAIIKPNLLEDIVDKATQVGVTNFCFYHAQRSKFKLDKQKQQQKIERFQKIAEAALKQSGTSLWPSFSFHDNIQTALESLTQENVKQQRFILLAETFDAKPEAQPVNFTTHLSSLAASRSLLEPESESADFQIIIGPEGGLCEEEVNGAKQHNFVPASLGQKTLRAETAAVVATGICASVFCN